MANVLFTWEMGANLGHMARLRPLLRLAAEQGHTLSVALRNLRFARRVLAGLEFRCFQAPFRQAVNPRPARECLSHAHTLEDFCFSRSDELVGYIKAWQEIFAAVRPDLVVYDSSPGALIASHRRPFGKVIAGNGFFIPPAAPRDGVFAPFVTTARDPGTLQTLRRNDRRMLQVLNDACRCSELPCFDSLGGIYSQAQLALYTTLPELDQFGPRQDAHYLGPQPSFGSGRPLWPPAGQDKVFCYLQNFAGIDTLLRELCDLDLKLLVYCRDLPPELGRRLTRGGNIAWCNEPVSFEAVGRAARFVVHHGGDTTAAQFLLQGVPQLCVPTKQDQLLTAFRLDRAGAGVTALHNQKSFAREIRQIHQQEGLRECARAFRRRYADLSWEQSEAWIGAQLKRLLEDIAA